MITEVWEYTIDEAEALIDRAGAHLRQALAEHREEMATEASDNVADALQELEDATEKLWLLIAPKGPTERIFIKFKATERRLRNKAPNKGGNDVAN